MTTRKFSEICLKFLISLWIKIYCELYDSFCFRAFFFIIYSTVRKLKVILYLIILVSDIILMISNPIGYSRNLVLQVSVTTKTNIQWIWNHRYQHILFSGLKSRSYYFAYTNRNFTYRSEFVYILHIKLVFTLWTYIFLNLKWQLTILS